MPKVYLEGVLKLVADNGFTNQETGEKIEYKTVYIQCETDEGDKVLELNTRLPEIKNFMDQEAVFTIGLRSDRNSSAFKLSLLEIVPNGKVIKA